MARSILSFGILSALALSITVRSAGFISGYPPPCFAAIYINFACRAKILPLLASCALFLLFMLLHLECAVIYYLPPVQNPLILYQPYIPIYNFTYIILTYF